jgi:hypothetical protein
MSCIYKIKDKEFNTLEEAQVYNLDYYDLTPSERIKEVGRIFNMNASGNIPSDANKSIIENSVEIFPSLKVDTAKNGKHFLHVAGKKFNPFKETFSSLSKEDSKKVTEETLNKVKDLMAKFGIKRKSLDNYFKEYADNHNGVIDTKSIQGIANIHEKIVAADSNESLTEEVIHLVTALSATDDPIFKKILELVDTTELYKEKNEVYREKYTRQAAKEGVTDANYIEELVRKEIADQLIANKLNESPVVYNRIITLIKALIRKMKAIFIQPDITDYLNDFKLEDLSPNKAYKLKFLPNAEFFSIKSEDFIKLNNLEKVLQENIKMLTLKSKKLTIEGSQAQKTKIAREVKALQALLDKNKAEEGFVRLLKFIQNDFEEVNNIVNSIKEGTRPANSNIINKLFTHVQYYEKMANDVKSTLELHGDEFNNAELLESMYDEIIPKIAKIRREEITAALKFTIKKLKEMDSALDIPERDWESMLTNASKDISAISNFVGVNAYTSDQVLRLIHAEIGMAEEQVNRENLEYGRYFVKKLKELGYEDKSISFAVDKDGHWISEYDRNTYHKNKTENKIANRLKVGKKFPAMISKNKKGEAYISKDNWLTFRAEIDRINNLERALTTREQSYLDSFKEYESSNKTWKENNSNLIVKNGEEVRQPKEKYKNPLYSKLSEQQKKLVEFLMKEAEVMSNKTKGRYKKYSQPQMSATMSERFKRGEAKDFIKGVGEGFIDTGDEVEYGDSTLDNNPISRNPDGSEYRTIPLFFTTKLQEGVPLTKDLASAMIAMDRNIRNYKSRLNLQPKLDIINRQASRRPVINSKNEIIKGGNKADKIDTFLSMNLYGRQRDPYSVQVGDKTVKVDKLVRTGNAYAKNVNLFGRIIIPLAGWFTAKINTTILSMEKKYLDPKAHSKGVKIYNNNISNIVMEAGKTIKQNKASQFLELIGLQSKDLFVNLDSSRLTRKGFEQGGYAAYGISGFDVEAKIALSKSEMYRLVNGKWQTPHTTTLTMEEFYTFPSLYESMVETKEGLEFPKSFSEVNKNRLALQISTINSEVQGLMTDLDKAKIETNFFSSLFTSLRSWAIKGFGKRLMKKGFDPVEGIVDEGSYVTSWELISNSFMNAENINILKQGLVEYHKLEPFQQANIRKSLLYFGILSSLLILSYAINSEAGEGDDDDFLLQYGAWLSNRVLMETAVFAPVLASPVWSSKEGIGFKGGFPVITETIAVAKSPFQATGSIEKLLDFHEFWNFEQVERGKFKDYTRSAKQFINLTPGLKAYHTEFNPRVANSYIKANAMKWAYNNP